jgi:hypothetical protein
MEQILDTVGVVVACVVFGVLFIWMSSSPSKGDG